MLQDIMAYTAIAMCITMIFYVIYTATIGKPVGEPIEKTFSFFNGTVIRLDCILTISRIRHTPDGKLDYAVLMTGFQITVTQDEDYPEEDWVRDRVDLVKAFKGNANLL